MDLESRNRWVEYSRAKDEMMIHTDTPESPWFVVEGDHKRAARLNCIAHLLSRIPYEPHREPDHPMDLPPRGPDEGYVRPDLSTQHHVPDFSGRLLDQG
jgi:hypothetical protein